VLVFRVPGERWTKKAIADDEMIGPLTVRFRSAIKVNDVMKMTGEGESEGLGYDGSVAGKR
jgi:hypothetical protein